MEKYSIYKKHEKGYVSLIIFGGGQGGGRPGEKGAGSGRKREKLRNIAQYFAIKKMQRAGAKRYRAGTGIKGYGKREIQTPLSPPPILEQDKNAII